MISYSAYYTEKFKKKLDKFSKGDKKKFVEKVNIFLENPFDSGLKTHKLSGKLESCWSFSLDFKTRILFRFSGKKEVEFIDLGGHDIYK